jgi:hypothetical protein
MRPRHPRHGHLARRQTAEQPAIRRLATIALHEGGHVPCSAHDGYAGEAVGHCGANAPSHGGLSSCLAQRSRSIGTNGGHGRCDLGEGGVATAMLDDVVPPTFRIILASSGREQRHRVDRRTALVVDRERVAQGEIDAAHRNTVFECETDRAPLRAETGERQKRGSIGAVEGVAEEGDGRAHRRIGRQGKDVVGWQRARSTPFGQALERPQRGRSQSVMADAEDVDGHRDQFGPSTHTAPRPHQRSMSPTSPSRPARPAAPDRSSRTSASAMRRPAKLAKPAVNGRGRHAVVICLLVAGGGYLGPRRSESTPCSRLIEPGCAGLAGPGAGC